MIKTSNGKPHRKICYLCSHLSAESSNFPGSKRNCVCYLYAYSRSGVLVLYLKKPENTVRGALCGVQIYINLMEGWTPEKYNRPTLYPTILLFLFLFFCAVLLFLLCEMYEQSQKSVFYFLILPDRDAIIKRNEEKNIK